jgi:hypothetical protein
MRVDIDQTWQSVLSGPIDDRSAGGRCGIASSNALDAVALNNDESSVDDFLAIPQLSESNRYSLVIGTAHCGNEEGQDDKSFAFHMREVIRQKRNSFLLELMWRRGRYAFEPTRPKVAKSKA